MPYLGSTIFIATIACLILLSILGSILLASACAGPFIERSARAASARPFRSIAVGLPLFAAALFSAAALLQGPAPAKLLGTLLAIVLAASSILGLASVASNVGGSLSANAQESLPYRRILRGAVVLELAAMLPIFGWFVVLPLALAAGLGAVTRTLFSRSERKLVAPPQHAWPPGRGEPVWPQSRTELPASEAYATRS